MPTGRSAAPVLPRTFEPLDHHGALDDGSDNLRPGELRSTVEAEARERAKR
jgi:hypothetical protein